MHKEIQGTMKRLMTCETCPLLPLLTIALFFRKYSLSADTIFQCEIGVNKRICQSDAVIQ